MLKFALTGKGENLRLRFDSRESERTLQKATARRVRSEATNNPSPTIIFTQHLKIVLHLVGFPSGQREQTVNLPSSTSKVRILPPPPSLTCRYKLSLSSVLHILRSGKDEKLRPRFDSSEARKRCRRQRPEGRGAARRVILPPPPSLTCRYKHSLNSLMHH